MRKQLAALVGIALAWSGTSAEAASAGAIPPATEADFRSAEIPAAVRNAWDATVFLSTRSWVGTSALPTHETGSGVVIHREDQNRDNLNRLWIATSAHVVACAGRCLVRVHLPRIGAADRTVSTSAEIVWRDVDQDLALLRCNLPRHAKVTVAHPAKGPLIAGTTVAAVGFPDLRLLGVKQRSSIPDKRFSSGQLVGKINGLKANYFSLGSRHAAGRLSLDHALTHDAALLPGSSGGPLVDAQGRVLGINTGSLTRLGDASCVDRRERCNVHLAVPIAALLELTRQLQTSRQKP